MHFHSKGTICRLQASHINHSEMTIPYFPPHIPYHSPIFIIHFPRFWVNHTSQNLNFWRFSRWWYTYPSEKYEFISWDDEIPNWMETINWCSKPPEKLASIGHVTSLFPKLPSLVVLGAALAIVLPMDLQHSEPGFSRYRIASSAEVLQTAPVGFFIFFQPVALIKTTYENGEYQKQNIW